MCEYGAVVVSTVPPRNRLRTDLLVILVTRMLVNTVYRAPVSFFPVITRDMGLSLEQGGVILTLRNLAGLVAPPLGPLSDRHGRVKLMAVGLLLLIAGCLTIGVAYSFAVLTLALLAATLGKIIYDPAEQAYLGDRVPYAQRGRVLALSELSWSGAGLVGIPLAGLLITIAGWRSPFVVTGLLVVGGLVLTWRVLTPVSASEQAGRARVSWRELIRTLASNPTAMAALCVSFLMDVGNENVNVVYAAWLNGRFALDANGLGLFGSVIGLAELTGELISSALVDRLGKKKTVEIGLLLSAGASAALPLLGVSPWSAALGLFLLFVAFEFALVSSLALFSEMMPTARGAFISLNSAAFLLGRATGSLSGPAVFNQFGFIGNGLVGAVVLLATAALWQTLVKDWVNL